MKSPNPLNLWSNLLNLPDSITNQTNNIWLDYTFGGQKIRKELTGGEERFYLGGLEVVEGDFEAFYHPEGRAVWRNDTLRFQYKLTDHLGNTVVLFEDKNLDTQILTEEMTGDTLLLEVLQRNYYYPFGMEMEGLWDPQTGPGMRYLYNGKEFNEDLNLNWYDYGARYYDPAIGRWNAVDPLAEKYAAWSPYNYTLDNPIRFIDPDGMSVEDYFVFDENGKYLRTEENEEPDQIVIENSKTGDRNHVLFNDPQHDSKLMRNTLDFWREDAQGMQLLFFVSDSDIESMMTESDIKPRNSLGRRLFTMAESVGGKMDFSAYHLPPYVAEKTGSPWTWTAQDVGITGNEKRSPFFILNQDKANAYNWLDAGNWLWGNAVNRLGGTFSNANNWARSYNKGDSFADLTAIARGWGSCERQLSRNNNRPRNP